MNTSSVRSRRSRIVGAGAMSRGSVRGNVERLLEAGVTAGDAGRRTSRPRRPRDA